MLTNKDHKKIARQKRRVNLISQDYILEGVFWLIMGLFGGFIMRQFGIRTSSGFGWGQICVTLWGIRKIWWGWRIR